jgi:hypothetical protein
VPVIYRLHRWIASALRPNLRENRIGKIDQWHQELFFVDAGLAC